MQKLLTIARAMVRADLRGEGDIIFCANVCEEGLGDLRGSKHLFGTDGSKESPAYDGFISIDDKRTAGIIYHAVGSERYQVNFHGAGGHSFTGFGIPNPIHAMGRAITKISDFQVPSNPKTTFSVGVVNGGTSVNVISAEASMLVDMRSVDSGALGELSERFHQAVKVAVEEENRRWGVDDQSDDRITVTMEEKGRRPAGTQSAEVWNCPDCKPGEPGSWNGDDLHRRSQHGCQYPYQSWDSGCYSRIWRKRWRRAYRS